MDEPEDEFDLPIFPFQNLHYVPCGSTGVVAPYIETGAGTMRAAVELMGLGAAPLAGASARRVVCDLGCGDASFLLGLLAHVNTLHPSPATALLGVGVDYDAALIAAGTRDALAAGAAVEWLTYDFNADKADLVGQLAALGVTHVFAYLVPGQLALPTVRAILTGLRAAGVVVCAYRYHPKYLDAVRVDEVMGLEVYER